MDIAELERKITEIMPGAVVETDNYGQLVIYTNLAEENDTLVTYNPGVDGFHKENV